jgi:hypothetical protein
VGRYSPATLAQPLPNSERLVYSAATDRLVINNLFVVDPFLLSLNKSDELLDIWKLSITHRGRIRNKVLVIQLENPSQCLPE